MSKILKLEKQDSGFKRADNSLLYIVYIRSVLFQKVPLLSS